MNPLVELFDPDGPVQQSRLLRLCIAFLDHEQGAELSAAVLTECVTDPRGERVALNGLLIAAVAAVSRKWEDDPVTAIADMRKLVAQLEGQMNG